MDASNSLMQTSSISEQKYTNLRKRLDQLGYRQTLGIESLPLIEKLFNDLVHTTESLKKTKLELSKVNSTNHNNSANNSFSYSGNNKNTSINDEDLITPSIKAYKADNSKLIKENNQLHLDLIKLKEDFEIQQRDLKSKLTKVENENSDLRFLNTQYLNKLRLIEKESKEKSKKIIELQEKNQKAIIQISGDNKQTISSFRRQRLDIDNMLPKSSMSTAHSQETDPYIMDMIKLADERIEQLQLELNNLKQTNEIIERKNSNFKIQLEHRDKEIDRLNSLLDGGKSRDIISLEAALENNEKLIKNQNIQIEYLQEKNFELEKRIEEILGKQIFNSATTSDTISRVLNENNNSKIELKSLEANNRQLDMEKIDLSNRLSVLKSELENKCEEIKNLHNLINKIQDDKAKLSKKISKLLENEKDLIQELEMAKSLKRSNSTTVGIRGTNMTNSTSGLKKQQSVSTFGNANSAVNSNKLDIYVKNLESERDFYKREIDTLKDLLKATQYECDTFKAKAEVYATSGSSAYHEYHVSRRDSQNNTSLHKKAKSISPCVNMKGTATRCSVCSSRIASTSNLNNHELYTDDEKRLNFEEIRKLRRERDELKALLDKFEKHMEEIQSNVRLLSSERDKYVDMYNDTKEELHRVKKEETKIANYSLASQSILKRIENERDTALYELRNAIKERDSLVERVKHTTEAATKDKIALEKNIDDLRDHLKKVDIEKAEFCQQVNILKRELEELENKLKTQNYHMMQTNQELSEQKSSTSTIRVLLEESERAIEEQKIDIKMKNEELQKLEQMKFVLEQKFINLQDLNRSLNDEINSLRMTNNTMDKEKDKLLMSLDEKTVENVTFKQELASKHRRIEELGEQLLELEEALDKTNNELKIKNKELTSLRILIDRVNEENVDLNRKYESSIRENKRLQEDVITVTRENQVIHCELEKANIDKDGMKEQLKDYLNEINKFEELLKQKENDRSSLLEQYRNITNEFNNMKLAINSFENDASNLRIELQTKHIENKRLRERIDKFEREFQQQLSANQEYEMKMSNANLNLQKLEETVKKLEHENKNLIQDLIHSRDININLEQAKEDMARQITSRELDNEQLQNQLYDRQAEVDLLKSQIHSERTMIKNLEELIANNREKDFHMQLSTQERDSEIKLLKERITLGEQKIQNQNKDINVLRTKIVEYETELEKLKRQLTNERFERERAAQELRKLSESTRSNVLSSSGATSPKKSLINYTSQSSTSCCRPTSPIMPLPVPSTTSSATAAAVAAAAAAVAASNVAAAASGYRSISPLRSSLTISKEQSTTLTNMRYSS